MLPYDRLETLKKTKEETNKVERLLRQSLKVATAFFTGVIITLAMYPSGHRAFGQTDSGSVSELPFMAPLGSISVTFVHNDTFELAPSEASDEAWQTILPNGLGFIQHPSLGEEIGGLAFVHQLHCVNSLRRGYYHALHGTASNETTHHVKHCLDYLRQAIMCHADTTMEYREEDIETRQIRTSGYSTHKCRDFEAVHDFAEAWRVWDGKNRPTQVKISEEENVPGRVIHYDYVSSRGDLLPA